MPIAVLSAMRESNARHMSVKGGRFLEAVAKADTIVFDKTGTLTYAQPRVAEVVTFGGRRRGRYAASGCLPRGATIRTRWPMPS